MFYNHILWSNALVYCSDIAEWELRSSDRRAETVFQIFFQPEKIQMKQLNDKVNFTLRRCQTGGKI